LRATVGGSRRRRTWPSRALRRDSRRLLLTCTTVSPPPMMSRPPGFSSGSSGIQRQLPLELPGHRQMTNPVLVHLAELEEYYPSADRFRAWFAGMSNVTIPVYA